MRKVCVTGAGGFIGHHLARYLKYKGYWVRGVDIKEPEFSDKNEMDEFLKIDLRNPENCLKATKGVDDVYNLAANMGGIGFITFHKSDVLSDNVLINTNMALACKENGVERAFYSSSACVYPISRQQNPNITALKEEDAYPAEPDNEYGWEKLFSERLWISFNKFFKVRIARFHNIYGEEGTFEGGREKAPAALCRKIAKGDEVEIWGDGRQTRSFCYIDDCVEGVYRLMNSDFKKPLNIGSDRLITIDELANIIAKTAGKKITIKYNTNKPQGVRGRNSDNALCKKVLNWQPQISLEKGLSKTYDWIKRQLFPDIC